MVRYRGAALGTVYIGGGTPSLLSREQIAVLGALIRDTFDTGAVGEMTCEVNPESVTPEKIEALRAIGINRVSMGLQSTDDEALRWLGRIHSVAEFERAYKTVRDAGCENVGIDLIYGLPDQTQDAWHSVLEKSVAYQPEHISLYGLTIERGTPLADRGARVNDDAQADMYEWAGAFLERRGFSQYEISNWARPGFESRHNLIYWRGGCYIGVGAAAASFDGSRRRVNDRDPGRYAALVKAGSDPVAEEELIGGPRRDAEHLMLGLRLNAGILLTQELRGRHGGTFDGFIRQGLMEMSGDHVRLTTRGRLVSNQVLQELI
jgi:oxygen-independent coproporphyrinogen-3 oxidase